MADTQSGIWGWANAAQAAQPFNLSLKLNKSGNTKSFKTTRSGLQLLWKTAMFERLIIKDQTNFNQVLGEKNWDFLPPRRY